MTRHLAVSGLSFALIAALFSLPVHAQTSGVVEFTVTESALSGTVACNGGAAAPISPVSGSVATGTYTNVIYADNISGQTCALPLYSIASVENIATADEGLDKGSTNSGSGTGNLQTVSLLGGALTYDSKSETNGCSVSDVVIQPSGTTYAVPCQGSAQISNLWFGGKHITGTFTQPTTFQANNLSISVPAHTCGALASVALFNGSLTVAGTSQSQTSSSNQTVTFAPLAVSGTLTCIGVLGGGSIKVALQDVTVLNMVASAGDVFQISTANSVTVQ